MRLRVAHNVPGNIRKWQHGICVARRHNSFGHAKYRRRGLILCHYQPTVLTGVSKDARMMNEEPFGPVAMIAPFTDFDEVVEEAAPAANEAGEKAKKEGKAAAEKAKKKAEKAKEDVDGQ